MACWGFFGKKFELDTTFNKPQCGHAQSLPFLFARRLEPDALPVIKEFDTGPFERGVF
jgi:hypothetical protein